MQIRETSRKTDQGVPLLDKRSSRGLVRLRAVSQLVFSINMQHAPFARVHKQEVLLSALISMQGRRFCLCSLSAETELMFNNCFVVIKTLVNVCAEEGLSKENSLHS